MTAGNKPLADRPLPLIARADLRWVRSRVAGEVRWSVQDPVTLRSYQMRATERFILNQLHGTTTLRMLRSLCEREFAPRKFSTKELFAFLQMVQREGLVLAETPEQGSVLYERRERELARRRNSRWLQVLAIRFPGVCPQPLLNWIDPKLRWLSTPWMAGAALLLVISAILLFVSQRPAMPTPQAFWHQGVGAGAVFQVIAAIGVTKMLHEGGHALVAARFGVPCRELGLMLLVFSPCLYCDVSDSAMLTNKWQRMAISAAGIGVELVLAAGCLWLGWLSEPGWFQQFCFLVAIVCSVNTLLINGNPLLRFDGYYVLADWWEVPNLQQAASAKVRAAMGGWFLHQRDLPRSFTLAPRRSLGLLIYGVLAAIYRMVVLAAILSLLYLTCASLGLQVLAYAVMMPVLFSAAVQPTLKTWQTWAAPGQMRYVRKGRAASALLAAAAIVSIIVLVPFEQHLVVPVRFEFDTEAPIYATVDGHLREAKAPGTRVQPGDVIARLENLELASSIAQLQLQMQQQRLFVEQLERAQVVDAAAVEQLASARAALDDLSERLDRRQRDQQQLKLVAATAGVIVPVPVAAADFADASDLPTWTGNVLASRNQGCMVQAGTLVCLVSDPTRHRAIGLVEEGQVARIQPGQTVRLRCPQVPGNVLEGRVVEVAQTDAAPSLPGALSLAVEGVQGVPTSGRAQRASWGGGANALRPPTRGPDADHRTFYETRIRIDAADLPIRRNAVGEAKIAVGTESWGRRVYRALRRQFGLF